MGKAKKHAVTRSGVELVKGMRVWVDTREMKSITLRKGDTCACLR
jgi:hypothetical protein